MRKLDVKQLPNAITVFRLILVPVLPIVFFCVTPFAALFVFLIAVFSDMLDGYLARKYDAISQFGQTMDPVADKMTVVVALLCLCIAGMCELWILVLMAVKELLMVLGGVMIYKKNTMVQPANLIGKVSTVVFFAAISLSFFGDALQWTWMLRYMAVALSVFSTLQYAAIILTRLKSGRA